MKIMDQPSLGIATAVVRIAERQIHHHFRLKDQYGDNRLVLIFTGRPWKARGLARTHLCDMLANMLYAFADFGYACYGANAVRRMANGDSIFLIRTTN